MAIFSLNSSTTALFFAVLLHLSLASGHLLSYAVHDTLAKYGLPKGLVPDAVDSFTLAADGTFEISLNNPSCFVQFSDFAHYVRIIRGKLSYGQISDLSGITARRFSSWLLITGMKMGDGGKNITFSVGPFIELHAEAREFEGIHACKSSMCRHGGRKEPALLTEE